MVAVHRLHALAPTAARSGRRPALRVIEGGANSSTPAMSSVSLAVVLAVMATMILVVTVRGVQGAPPASDWPGLAATPAAATAADHAGGDVAAAGTYTVAEGDTWATIAAQVAPGADVVDVARQLASVNGGYAIEPGQSLIVELTAPVGG